jgi:hypothetical protein
MKTEWGAVHHPLWSRIWTQGLPAARIPFQPTRRATFGDPTSFAGTYGSCSPDPGAFEENFPRGWEMAKRDYVSPIPLIDGCRNRRRLDR